MEESIKGFTYFGGNLTLMKMKKMNRGDKIYLNKSTKKDSLVSHYLEVRDGIVEAYEYVSSSGYGSESILFLCTDYKSETGAIIRHTYNGLKKEWIEDYMTFDIDEMSFIRALLNGEREQMYGKYTLVRG